MYTVRSEQPLISMTEDAAVLFKVWRDRFETRNDRAGSKDSTKRQLRFALAGMVISHPFAFLCLVRESSGTRTFKLVPKIELVRPELALCGRAKVKMQDAKKNAYRRILEKQK